MICMDQSPNRKMKRFECLNRRLVGIVGRILWVIVVIFFQFGLVLCVCVIVEYCMNDVV